MEEEGGEGNVTGRMEEEGEEGNGGEAVAASRGLLKAVAGGAEEGEASSWEGKAQVASSAKAPQERPVALTTGVVVEEGGAEGDEGKAGRSCGTVIGGLTSVKVGASASARWEERGRLEEDVDETSCGTVLGGPASVEVGASETTR